MTLAHLGVILAQNQGNMTEYRFFKAQSIVYQALARSVGQMLLSADYMGNMHQSIVNYNCIVVGRNTIGFYDYKIADVIGIKNNVATNQVTNQNLLVSRHTEANSRLAAFGLILSNLLRSQVAAFAHIARHLALFNQGLTLLLQLLVGAVAVVSLALSQQLVSIFFVDVKTFHLVVGAIFAAYINALIPVHTKPF